VITPVGIEKLISAKIAKMKLRQDAISAIFSDRKTFPVSQIWPFEMKSEFFNTHAC